MVTSRRLFLSGLCACCALGLLAARTAPAADGETTLARTFKKGDVARYRSNVEGQVMGADFTVVATFKSEVTDVKPNGDVVTVEAEEESRLTVMGMEMQTPPSPPATFTHNKLGRLVDYQQDNTPLLTPERVRLMALLQEPILSDKAVKSGAEWQTELDNPAAAGKKVVVKGTFMGLEKVGDQELWKVRQTAEAETGEASPLVTDTTYWLHPSDGRLVRLESKVQGVPTQFGLMNWTEKRERL